MRKKENSRPKSNKTFLILKILALPVWLATSVLTVSLGGWLLYHGSQNTPVEDQYANLVSDEQVPYQLFAALPKKGQVLSQRVDYGDARLVKLKSFLRFYHSPMLEAAESFIQVADTYQIPWNLLPAIACKESGCGRVLPYNSFNAFGWAIYTGQNSGAVFGSWADAIERVGRGLREDYFNKGLDTVESIETRYTPSSARSHNGWRDDVMFFMEEMETWGTKT